MLVVGIENLPEINIGTKPSSKHMLNMPQQAGLCSLCMMWDATQQQ